MAIGKIKLERYGQNYSAGFCLLRNKLSDLQDKLHLLHQHELDYFFKLTNDNRRQSFLLGRLAAKMAIAEINSTQPISSFYIGYGVFQFPVVKNCNTQNIQVCVSHCDDVCIAVAFPEEHPLGIDIERIDADKTIAIQNYISAKEIELLANNNLTDLIGSIIIWTAKEALSKVLKTGMMIDFSVLEIESIKRDGRFYVSDFRYCAQYKAITCHAGNYVCSLIIPKKTEPLVDGFWNAFVQAVGNEE